MQERIEARGRGGRRDHRDTRKNARHSGTHDLGSRADDTNRAESGRESPDACRKGGLHQLGVAAADAAVGEPDDVSQFVKDDGQQVEVPGGSAPGKRCPVQIDAGVERRVPAESGRGDVEIDGLAVRIADLAERQVARDHERDSGERGGGDPRCHPLVLRRGNHRVELPGGERGRGCAGNRVRGHLGARAGDRHGARGRGAQRAAAGRARERHGERLVDVARLLTEQDDSDGLARRHPAANVSVLDRAWKSVPETAVPLTVLIVTPVAFGDDPERVTVSVMFWFDFEPAAVTLVGRDRDRRSGRVVERDRGGRRRPDRVQRRGREGQDRRLGHLADPVGGRRQDAR